jgi:hypothetical protein
MVNDPGADKVWGTTEGRVWHFWVGQAVKVVADRGIESLRILEVE